LLLCSFFSLLLSPPPEEGVKLDSFFFARRVVEVHSIDLPPRPLVVLHDDTMLLL